MLKQRDSDVRRVILVVADTRGNRDALREVGPTSGGNYPIARGAAIRALQLGVDPGGNAIVTI